MTSNAETPEQYLEELPQERKEAVKRIWEILAENLPEGFKGTMSYGMLGFVVPHELYPAGYHCDPKLPLPFVNVASQKNFIALYHMGLYADPALLKWFTGEYAKYSKTKPDMGKSCIRFKKPEQIPYELIGQLAQKITVSDWIGRYEKLIKPKT